MRNFIYTLTSILLLLAGASQKSYSTTPTNPDMGLQNANKQFFIENKGQWSNEVLYLTQLPNLNIWLTKSGVRYDYFEMIDLPESSYTDHDRYLQQRYKQKKQGTRGHVIDIVNTNANTAISTQGKDKLTTYYNYFLGNESTQWASNVGLYEEVLIKDIYQGIDQRWYFDNGRLRYDYIVQPHINPNQIQLNIKGANVISIKENNLYYVTRFGDVQHTNLYVYQPGENNQKIPVDARWKLENGLASFDLSQYDKSKPLIIDPILQSTYIGGNNNDLIYDLATPGSPSEKYVCGATLSANYPFTIGTYDETFNSNFDVVVSRFTTGLNALQFSTFLGHTGDERAYGIAVNTIDGIYITGVTYSPSFPTFNAYDNSYFNNGDVFVTKLNLSGNSLIYSTFLGLSGTDIGNAIDINSSGEAFITGQTTGGFPVTTGVVQNTLIGVQNAFITKINANGNTLGYSTFLGRSNDIAFSIKVDGSNNVYISGETFSSDLPVTAGVFGPTHSGGKDAFVAKLNPTATQILALSYLGGSNNEIYPKIALDYSMNVYVAGGSASTNFPTTVGAYVNNPGNSNYDVFVTKINPSFTSMLYSTKFGQTFDDYAQDIVVDAAGFAHIAAYVSGASFPVTPGADFITSRGNADIAIVKLNQAGSGLVYSSYYGGANSDIVSAIDLNYSSSPKHYQSNNIVSFAGYTNSTNYHTAGSPLQSTFAGGTNDGFCTSLSICGIVNPNNGGSIPFNDAICSGSSVNYTMNASGGASPYSYIWTEYFGNPINTTAGVTLSPSQTTQYVYAATDANGCVGSNIITIIVNPSPTAGAPSVASICQNQAISPAITINTTNATGIGTPIGLPTGVSASYSSNQISLTGTPTIAGTFNYTIPLTGSCSGNATGTIEVLANSSYTGTSNQTVCNNAALTPIILSTTGVTGIGMPSNLPPGVSALFSSNTVTISGTPTSSGVFNYTIPLTGCGSNNITGTITVNPNNTFSGSTNGTTCINTLLTPIIINTTGATGISSVTNLPAGVSASFSSNTITISGTPTDTGTFNYSMNLTGGCGSVSVSGTITVNPDNTVSGSSNQTVCVNSPLTPINLSTTGATGIGTPTGLPAGVNATWNANVLTISGTPTIDGVFNYTIPLTGGCGNVNVTGTITVNPTNTVTGLGNQTLCISDALTPVTFNTSGATGIGTPSGLPGGVNAVFSSNTITISGTPASPGFYNYSIPLTGGCGIINATGTITVNGLLNVIPLTNPNINTCVNNPMNEIRFLVQDATGINTVNNLPAGVTATMSFDTLIISGIPTTTGVFSYEISFSGCGFMTAQGNIMVMDEPTFNGNPNQTVCVNNPLSINIATTDVFGIGSPVGLPTGITASYASNNVTISGSSLQPGVYNYTIPLITNCNNLSLIGTITIDGPITTVTQSGNTLTATQAGANYQWIDCNNANAPITGETAQSFTPVNSGNYAVEITLSSCTITSTCTAVTVNVSGIEENDEDDYFLYPNPAATQFTIANAEPGTRISIIDMAGKLIQAETVSTTNHTVYIDGLANGMYIIQLENNGQISQKKLVINK